MGDIRELNVRFMVYTWMNHITKSGLYVKHLFLGYYYLLLFVVHQTICFKSIFFVYVDITFLLQRALQYEPKNIICSFLVCLNCFLSINITHIVRQYGILFNLLIVLPGNRKSCRTRGVQEGYRKD